MAKRLIILSMLAGMLAVAGTATAACDGAGAGHHNGASVEAALVTGYDGDGVAIVDPADVVTVTIVADVAGACGDGTTATTGPLGAATTLTVAGATPEGSCSAETTSDWDPFGFGAGIHDDVEANTTCSADISWGGFTSAYAPDLDRSGAGAEGASAALGKDATVENGIVKVNGATYRAHGIGRMWTGPGAATGA